VWGPSGTAFGTEVWFQIYHDGTTLFLRCSNDGVGWINIYTEAYASWVLPSITTAFIWGNTDQQLITDLNSWIFHWDVS
jgi:hypothetical protein